jgi:hypothetical protein
LPLSLALLWQIVAGSYPEAAPALRAKPWRWP